MDHVRHLGVVKRVRQCLLRCNACSGGQVRTQHTLRAFNQTLLRLACSAVSCSSSSSISSSSVGLGLFTSLVSPSLPLSCHSMSLLNAPLRLLVNSSYVPSSASFPSALIHNIRSDLLMVDRRCAMLMVVLLSRRSLLNAWLTSVSDSASRALVASSRMRISGFLIRARAMAIRCFCPPES